MEAYKAHITSEIVQSESSIDDLYNYQYTKRNQFIFHFNERGQFHSKYLGNRYEPAIIFVSEDACRVIFYYLFNGKLLDCDHPAIIVEDNSKLTSVTYFSSKRITENQPIRLTFGYTNQAFYNTLDSGEPILDGYKTGVYEFTDEMSKNTGDYIMCNAFQS